jgi:hypothetical protein
VYLFCLVYLLLECGTVLGPWGLQLCHVCREAVEDSSKGGLDGLGLL